MVDRMIVIQSGVIEVSIQYDKRRENELFIVERLGKGAILNAKAFVLKDKAKTDFICRTKVSCFELTYDKLKTVMIRRADLQQARKDIKMEILKPVHSVALDYILHNNEQDTRKIAEQLTKNELKVKFKNAAMQMWTQVKKDAKPKNIDQLIEEMLDKKRRKDKQLGIYKSRDEQLQQEDRTEEEMLKTDSEKSFFSLDQYGMLNKKIESAQSRLKEQQSIIDHLDGQVSERLQLRLERLRLRSSTNMSDGAGRLRTTETK